MITLRIGGVPEHYNHPWHMHMQAASATPESRLPMLRWRDYPEGTGRMIEALNNGELDLAVLLTEGAISGIARGGDFRVVGFFTDATIVWGIHVPPDSAIRTTADIYQHRYAISRYGSGSHLMPYVHARGENWPVHKLQFVRVNDLDGARLAFREHRADVFFWEKYTTQPFVSSGEFRRIGEYPTPWPGFVLVASVKKLTLHRSAIEQVFSAVLQQAQALLADPERVTVIARRYALAKADARAWFEYTRWAEAIDPRVDVLESVCNTLKELGLVQQLFDPRTLCAVA